jgi:hypothetical protein
MFPESLFDLPEAILGSPGVQRPTRGQGGEDYSGGIYVEADDIQATSDSCQ